MEIISGGPGIRVQIHFTRERTQKILPLELRQSPGAETIDKGGSINSIQPPLSMSKPQELSHQLQGQNLLSTLPTVIEKVTLSSSPNFSLDCPPDQISAFKTWLKAYAQGQDLPFSLPLPLPLPRGTFRGDVLRFLQTIPRGSVCSYQEVAKGVGNPRAARAVGNICRGNLFPLLIPCHRVIRSDGEIGGYTPDPSIKRQLLQFEGLAF